MSSSSEASPPREQYWNVEESFSLLNTATGLFLDTYRATDDEVVFKSSGQSLRAVLILPLGCEG